MCLFQCSNIHFPLDSYQGHCEIDKDRQSFINLFIYVSIFHEFSQVLMELVLNLLGFHHILQSFLCNLTNIPLFLNCGCIHKEMPRLKLRKQNKIFI